MPSRLAVIEGKWIKNKNISTKNVFDLLCDFHFDNPHDYHYEMFNDGNAFKEIVSRISTTRGIRYLYVAAHGDDSGIYGSNGILISRKAIRKALEVVNSEGATLKGVYFSSCSFMTTEGQAEFILEKLEKIEWIAGYSKIVDWIESAAFDWCFWNIFFQEESESERKRINSVADFIKENMEGFRVRLGF